MYHIAQSFGWDYKPRSILATHAFDLARNYKILALHRRWFRSSWCWESVSYIQTTSMHRINEDEYMWAKEKSIWMIEKEKNDWARIKDGGKKGSWPWICVLTPFYPGRQPIGKTVICRTVNRFDERRYIDNHFFITNELTLKVYTSPVWIQYTSMN